MDASNSTSTVEVNVYDGVLTLTDPIEFPEPFGGVVERIEVGPWGEDEFSMDRADEGLAAHGLVRLGNWKQDFDVYCATVTLAK